MHLKNNWLFVLLAVLTLAGSSSCKKMDTTLGLDTPPLNETVTAWLDAQKSTASNTGGETTIQTNSVSKRRTPNKDATIDLLKENLDLDNSAELPKKAYNQFIITPIKDGFKKAKNIDRRASLKMLFIRNKKGGIVSGYIAHFLPDGNNSEPVSATTIDNVLNDKPVTQDGTLTFTTPSGSFQASVKYKNGKVISSSVLKSEKSSSSNQKTDNSEVCIEWFLITLTTYTDGTTSETKEYVGTTCHPCDDFTFINFCTPSGGGGGSGVGSGPTPPPEELEQPEYYTESGVEASQEIDTEELPSNLGFSAGSFWDRIDYLHFYEIEFQYYPRAGVKHINWILPLDVKCRNPLTRYGDEDGEYGTRTITLGNQVNTWSWWLYPIAKIDWSCSVLGIYRTPGSTRSRFWYHYYSKKVS